MSRKTILILFLVLAVAAAALYFAQPKKQKAPQYNPGATPPIKGPTPSASPKTTVAPGRVSATQFPLHKGARGKAVQMLQVLVGVTPDGIFGVNTEAAVKRVFGKISISEQDFAQFCIMGLGSTQRWPLQYGNVGNYVKALEILLDQPTIDGNFDTQLENALEAITNSRTIAEPEFITLASNIMQINFLQYVGT